MSAFYGPPCIVRGPRSAQQSVYSTIAGDPLLTDRLFLASHDDTKSLSVKRKKSISYQTYEKLKLILLNLHLLHRLQTKN